jgi:hypothetical protein
MTFPAKPTTKDLSGTKELSRFPSFDSSQAGGNTITEKNPDFGGQGSDSEATHDVVFHELTDFGNVHPTPDLPGPETPASSLDVDEKGSGYTPSARTWKEL